MQICLLEALSRRSESSVVSKGRYRMGESIKALSCMCSVTEMHLLHTTPLLGASANTVSMICNGVICVCRALFGHVQILAKEAQLKDDQSVSWRYTRRAWVCSRSGTAATKLKSCCTPGRITLNHIQPNLNHHALETSRRNSKLPSIPRLACPDTCRSR